MNKIYVRTLVLLLIVSIFETKAQQATPTKETFSFNLQQAIDYALKNKTDVANALLDEQIAKNKVKEITGIGLPQISGSFDSKYFIEIPTQLVPADFFGGPPGSFAAVQFGTKYNTAAGVTASQLLFDGTYIVGLQASKTYVELSQKAIKRTQIEAATAVAKAYYSVLVNDERMKLLDANVERIKKLADDTKALNDNGFVEKIDLDRITVAYNNLVVEKEKIKRLLELSTHLLKYQMGMNQSVQLTLTEKISDIKFQPTTTIANEKFNYSSRIEYSLFESQRKSAELKLKSERFAHMPSIFLYGNASANRMGNKFDVFDTKMGWYPTILVGGTVNVPIFSGLQKHYKIQQAKIEVAKANNNLQFMEQSIDLELASSKTNLQNATATLDMQKKNIELAEEVYRVSKLKYEQGVGSNLEVLTAETSLKESQTNYYNALFDALVAKIDFDKAIGGLVK
ncbi:MAG: TolC family protein [Bacteroidetes bacterium]|nr:TolC family protein [Bacteroidota bacterium]